MRLLFPALVLNSVPIFVSMTLIYFSPFALSAKIAAFAKSSKFSVAARGFPGRFKMKVLPMRPKVVGLPGLISTFSKSGSKSKQEKASFVKSASPTLTPPEVMIRS